MAKSFELTFSLSVKVTPTHSPSANVVKDTEPFLRPTVSCTVQPTPSECTGTDFSAVKHQSTSQLESDRHQPGSTFSERTGTDPSATKHKSTSKFQRDQPHTDQPRTDRPKPIGLNGTDSPVLHRSVREDSISSFESEAESKLSD